MSRSGTPQQTFRLPANPLYLLSHMPPPTTLTHSNILRGEDQGYLFTHCVPGPTAHASEHSYPTLTYSHLQLPSECRANILVLYDSLYSNKALWDDSMCEGFLSVSGSVANYTSLPVAHWQQEVDQGLNNKSAPAVSTLSVQAR